MYTTIFSNRFLKLISGLCWIAHPLVFLYLALLTSPTYAEENTQTTTVDPQCTHKACSHWQTGMTFRVSDFDFSVYLFKHDAIRLQRYAENTDLYGWRNGAHDMHLQQCLSSGPCVRHFNLKKISRKKQLKIVELHPKWNIVSLQLVDTKKSLRNKRYYLPFDDLPRKPK